MTIVVGYVPTPEGTAAVTAAIEEAQTRDAPLLVVNASHGGAYIDSSLAGEAQLGELRGRLDRAGVKHEISQPGGQDAVEVLLELTGEPSTELLVIGLRRRSPVGKLLLGSTAQRLLLEAECPVLAVKAAR